MFIQAILKIELYNKTCSLVSEQWTKISQIGYHINNIDG